MQDKAHPALRRMRWDYSRARGAMLMLARPERQAVRDVVRTTDDAAQKSTNHPQHIDAEQAQPSIADEGFGMKVGNLGGRPAMYTEPILKRAIWLMSDAIVLTLASPFFAVWWLQRAVRRYFTKP